MKSERMAVMRSSGYSRSRSRALRCSMSSSMSTGTYSTGPSSSRRMRVLRAAPLPSSTRRTCGPKAAAISRRWAVSTSASARMT